MGGSNLTGQVAIITGAGSGIGAATAKLLAAQGMSLVINGRTDSKLTQLQTVLTVEVPQASVHVFVGDVSDAQVCHDLVAFTLKHCNRLDVLVNNAGIAGKIGLLTEVPVSEVHQTIDTNLKGPVFMMQEALRQWMVPNQQGTIININSIAGKTAFPYWSVYNASKFGLRAITETVAEEQKLNNIKVVSLYPGAVATPIWDKVDLDTDPSLAGMMDPDTIAEAVLYVLQQPAKVTIPELMVTPLKPAL